MRFRTHKSLYVLGLIMTLAAATVFGSTDDDKNKRPKNTGILTIRTTPESYPVKVDGQYVGMSGVGSGADFFLTPGFHTVRVDGPDGRFWTEELEIKKDQRNAVCLKVVTETLTHPCPYRFTLDGPDKVSEGDLVTFAAVNQGTAPIPLRYTWRITPDNARVTSGLGTPSITVDTTGMGARTITAELDVNDSTYDNKCRQLLSAPTEIVPLPPPEEKKPFRCDEFEARTPDDDKARFDNCVIQAQNTPDSQLYVIIYPGTDKASMTRNSYEKLSKRALDYMVKTRGFDPRRLSIVKGSSRLKTTYEIWIVPPGAQPPVVQ